MPEQTFWLKSQVQAREVDRGPLCRDLKGWYGKKKRAPIVDTRNVEGAKGKRIWLVGGGIIGRLTG